MARRRGWDHMVEPRLAFVSPLPPAATGVATYSRAVLDGLRRIGFFQRHRMDVVWPIEPKHEAWVPWYRLAVYQLGNNVEFHRDVYRHAMQSPGLVVLHDLALDDFVRGMLAAGDPLGHRAKREALALADRMTSADAMVNEPLRVPWCADVARRARGVVVHSEFGRRYLGEFGCRTPVFVVPHPPVEREEDLRRATHRRAELRAPLEARGARTVVGVFGDLNQAKLIDVVLEAVGSLPSEVHALLVGRRIEGYEADRVVEASGLGERVTLRPDVSDHDFLGLLAASDVVVDLRFPHRGEVSGSLARAMQMGKPCVVSATGTYRDISGDLVVHVSAGRPEPAEVAAALGRLADDADLRERLGERARLRMAELAAGDRTAHAYAEAIEETLRLVLDPARRALARWAGALLDMGLTEEHLRLGYGASYARALEEFSPAGEGDR